MSWSFPRQAGRLTSLGLRDPLPNRRVLHSRLLFVVGSCSLVVCNSTSSTKSGSRPHAATEGRRDPLRTARCFPRPARWATRTAPAAAWSVTTMATEIRICMLGTTPEPTSTTRPLPQYLWARSEFLLPAVAFSLAGAQRLRHCAAAAGRLRQDRKGRGVGHVSPKTLCAALSRAPQPTRRARMGGVSRVPRREAWN